MYIHIGNGKIVSQSEIIGVFDMDNSTISKYTRKMLNKAQKEDRLVNLSYDIPRSIIVTESRIYFSTLSSKAIVGRSRDLF